MSAANLHLQIPRLYQTAPPMRTTQPGRLHMSRERTNTSLSLAPPAARVPVHYRVRHRSTGHVWLWCRCRRRRVPPATEIDDQLGAVANALVGTVAVPKFCAVLAVHSATSSIDPKVITAEI